MNWTEAHLQGDLEACEAAKASELVKPLCWAAHASDSVLIAETPLGHITIYRIAATLWTTIFGGSIVFQRPSKATALADTQKWWSDCIAASLG